MFELKADGSYVARPDWYRASLRIGDAEENGVDGSPPMKRTIKFDIADTSIALEADGGAKPLDERETMWDYAASGRFGDVTRLVSRHRLTADWTSWELHPLGDAIILLLDGTIEVNLEGENPSKSADLEHGGTFARIPRGTWHTVTVRRPSTVLLIAPSAEARQRPR